MSAVHTMNSGVLTSTVVSGGQPDDPEVYGDQECTACCALQSVREYDTWTINYSYSAGWGWDPDCDPLYNPCQCPAPGHSETITRTNNDTGWVTEEYASQHVCFDELSQTASRLVYGASNDYNCDYYNDVDYYKELTLDTFEYAAGVSSYDCTEFQWNNFCNCDEDKYEAATCCTASFGDGGLWAWSADFTLYDVFDRDVYVDSHYEHSSDFLGEVITTETTDPTINGSSFSGFTFDGDLECFSPIQSVPQNANEGVSFVARHSAILDNQFASYTTRFSDGASLDRVRCKKGTFCYEEDAEDFEQYWSILMNRKGSGVIIYKQDDESYYGRWYVYIYTGMEAYTPTTADIEGYIDEAGNPVGGWADPENFKYINVFIERASLQIPIVHSTQSYRQSFRVGVTCRA